MCSIYLRNRSYKGENWTMKFQYFTLILSKVRSWTVFFCFLQTFIPNFAGWFFYEVLHQDRIIHHVRVHADQSHFDTKSFARVLFWNRENSQHRNGQVNTPFPAGLRLPLSDRVFLRSYSYENAFRLQVHVHSDHDRFCTKTRFEAEAVVNSEMTTCVYFYNVFVFVQHQV